MNPTQRASYLSVNQLVSLPPMLSAIRSASPSMSHEGDTTLHIYKQNKARKDLTQIGSDPVPSFPSFSPLRIHLTQSIQFTSRTGKTKRQRYSDDKPPARTQLQLITNNFPVRPHEGLHSHSLETFTHSTTAIHQGTTTN